MFVDRDSGCVVCLSDLRRAVLVPTATACPHHAIQKSSAQSVTSPFFSVPPSEARGISKYD